MRFLEIFGCCFWKKWLEYSKLGLIIFLKKEWTENELIINEDVISLKSNKRIVPEVQLYSLKFFRMKQLDFFKNKYDIQFVISEKINLLKDK